MPPYQTSKLVADEKAGLQDWSTVYPKFKKTRQQIIDLVDRGDASSAAPVRTDTSSPLTPKSTDAVSRLLAVQQSVGSQMNQDTALMAELSVRVLVFAIFAALV